jgi:hypothetical protein
VNHESGDDTRSAHDSDTATFATRLARMQVAGFATIALCVIAVTGAAGYAASGLPLRTAWEELLPDTKPSVLDIDRVRSRMPGRTTLVVVVEGQDGDALLRYGEDLARRLESTLVPSRAATAIDWRVDTYTRFVEERRHLYADLADLKEIESALRERIDWEKARKNPFFVDLGEEPPEDPDQVLDRMKQKADRARERAARHPKGMYANEARTAVAIFVRTDVRASDVDKTSALIASVKAHADALRPASYHSSLKVGFTGDVFTAREEHDAVKQELFLASALTMIASLLAIFLFFRHARTIPLLGLGIALPTAVTFAFARLTVGQLNTSTAFLGSIIIGNGINPGIMWLARFVEERARGVDLERAIAVTHRETWRGTLGASLAASLAYGSLSMTDFRGFRDFGIIGGFGMLFCWALTYLALPAWVVLFERVRSMRAHRATGGASFTRFAGFARHAPRGVLATGLALAVAGTLLGALAVVRDPIEYQFRKLRSERDTVSEARRLSRLVTEFAGRTAAGFSTVMLLERREDLDGVLGQLETLRRGPAGDHYGPVRSIRDLLPKDQEAKRPILASIRALALEAKAYATEEQGRRIDEQIPPERVTAVTDQDLPQEVARPFTERDGTRGRLLLIESAQGRSTYDGRYLIEWTGAVRKVRVDGEIARPAVVGNGPVFADMVESIWVDGPRAIAASFIAVLLLVLVSFRDRLYRWLSMGVLLAGIAWMTGILAIAILGFDKLRLNFLNFVALPITFGIGVDYCTNVVQRFAREVRQGGADPVRAAIDETGGAVVLCSMTTIIGYSSLQTSASRALQSFGQVAVLGELCTMLAAQLLLPAAFVLILRRRGSSR